MTKDTRTPREAALDVVNAFAGICLVVSPWLLDFAADITAARNAWIAGFAVTLLAVGAAISFKHWAEWIILALAVWTVVAPWVLGFSGITGAVMAHVMLGGVVAAFAAAELWFSRKRELLHHGESGGSV